MDRKSWIRVVEIVLVLPATAYLAPMAAFIALGMMFAVGQDAGLGITAELMLMGVVVSFLAAPVGMLSLWMTMLMPYDALARHRILRILLLMGIGVGIADAVYWLWALSRHPHTAWNIWLLMLAGPIMVSMRYAFRLVRLTIQLRSPKPSGG